MSINVEQIVAKPLQAGFLSRADLARPWEQKRRRHASFKRFKK
jgi:hypothetical protein